MLQEDSELLARILVEDDRDAFEILIKKYQSPVRSLFRKLTGGDDILADDLSQETFMNAYRGIRSFKGKSKIQTWLFSIARNVYLQHVRKQADISSETTDEIVEPNKHTDDMKIDLHKCMLMLEPNDRMLLAMAYAEGMSHGELAETLNMPVGTVKTNILKAKALLVKYLKSYERGSL